MAKERYVSFGQQMGVIPSLTLPLDAVTTEFRNAIWNVVEPLYTGRGQPYPVANPTSFLVRMADDKNWVVDDFRGMESWKSKAFIKNWVIKDESSAWHEVYDFLKHFPRWAKLDDGATLHWRSIANLLLEDQRSPYAFVGAVLSQRIGQQELTAVESAAQLKDKYESSSELLIKALGKFGARPQPDYENAVKESASALETALTIANGKHMDMSSAVKEFARTFSVHPGLMESASKFFGYACDRDGVRHGNKAAVTASGLPSVDVNEARLAIITAAAWLNFIAAKSP